MDYSLAEIASFHLSSTPEVIKRPTSLQLNHSMPCSLEYTIISIFFSAMSSLAIQSPLVQIGMRFVYLLNRFRHAPSSTVSSGLSNRKSVKWICVSLAYHAVFFELRIKVVLYKTLAVFFHCGDVGLVKPSFQLRPHGGVPLVEARVCVPWRIDD